MQTGEHTLGHILWRMSVYRGKPVVKLFPDGLSGEFVTFQAFAATTCGVGVAGGRVSHAQQVPASFGQVDGEWCAR